MRQLFRISLLLLLLGAYLAQVAAAQIHPHEGAEHRIDCAACLSQAVPGTPPQEVAQTPAEYFASFGSISEQELPPPPSLEERDVSYGTDPPRV